MPRGTPQSGQDRPIIVRFRAGLDAGPIFLHKGMAMTGATLIARWFVENGLPQGFTERDLVDLADRIDAALEEARNEGTLRDPRWRLG